jgi:AGZA family xanthine/uracil permease-like MFS transporter
LRLFLSSEHFLSPLIASIPPWATGGALILVGAIMCRSLGQVRWHDTRDATTAFLTVIIMPLTYSIAYGLIAGIGAYLVFTLAYKAFELVGVPPPTFEEDDIVEIKSSNKEESSM